MKTVTKSVLIWYSPQEMYALVTDVDRYAEFLPWCDKARVVSSDESGMLAEIGISFSGIAGALIVPLLGRLLTTMLAIVPVAARVNDFVARLPVGVFGLRTAIWADRL